MSVLNDIKKNFLKVFLYTLYGILCFFIFLFIKFPFDKVVDGVISSIETQYQYKVTKGRSGYAFPIGVSFEGVEVWNTNGGSKPYKIDKLRISFPISSLIFFKNAFNFRADAFDGRISGAISMDTDRLNINAETLKNVEMSELMAVSADKGIKLKGPTKFNLSVVMQNDNARTLSGTGQIEITNGSIENISPFLKSLKLDKGGFVFESTRGRGNVKNFFIEGSGVKIAGNGTFKIGDSLEKTNVKMKLFGEYDPSNEIGKAIALMGIKGKKNIPVELSGLISKMDIKVEGKSIGGTS